MYYKPWNQEDNKKMTKPIKKTNKSAVKVTINKNEVKNKSIVKQCEDKIRTNLAVFDNKNLENKKLFSNKEKPKVEIKVSLPSTNKATKVVNVYTGPLNKEKKPALSFPIFSNVLLKKLKVKKEVFEKLLNSDKSSTEIAKQVGLAARTIRKVRNNLKK